MSGNPFGIVTLNTEKPKVPFLINSNPSGLLQPVKLRKYTTLNIPLEIYDHRFLDKGIPYISYFISIESKYSRRIVLDKWIRE